MRREVFLGESKLDFLVGDVFLEVKTPLQHLQVNVPEWVKTKKATPLSSTGRMRRHVVELADSLADHQRAIFLTCFIYDNPGFEVVEKSTNYSEVKHDMDAAQARSVEIWQANFEPAHAARGCAVLTENNGYYLMELTSDGEPITREVLDEALRLAEGDMNENVFRAMLRPLSRADVDFLQAMAQDEGTTRVGDLEGRLGVSQGHVQSYRKRLIEAGVVIAPRRGELEFIVPGLARYLRDDER